MTPLPHRDAPSLGLGIPGRFVRLETTMAEPVTWLEFLDLPAAEQAHLKATRPELLTRLTEEYQRSLGPDADTTLGVCDVILDVGKKPSDDEGGGS